MNQYQKYILSEGKYRCNPSGLDIARDIAHGEKFGVVARKHHVPREVVYACVFALDIAAPIGAVQLAVFRILKRHWGGDIKDTNIKRIVLRAVEDFKSWR